MMQLQMNIHIHLPILGFVSHPVSSSSLSFSSYSPFRILSSKRDFQESQPNGDNNNKGLNSGESTCGEEQVNSFSISDLGSTEVKENGETLTKIGDKSSTDWDKAWSKFKKQGRKTLFSQFSPDKYVSWNPRRSEFPLSEEVDPIKRTERSNLMFWTSPAFTLSVAILIVTFLLLYTILAPIK